MSKHFSALLVSLIIFILIGCGGADTKQIDAITPPDTTQIKLTANINADNTIIKKGQSVTFDTQGTIGIDDASYAWLDSDGKVVSTEQNYSKIFETAGKHSQTLRITNKKGEISERVVTITVMEVSDNTTPNIPPVAKAQISESEISVGEGVRFSSEGSSDSDGHIVAYEWRDMDGILLSTQASFSRGFPYAGTYKKTLTVVDDRGARSSFSVELVVIGKPTTPTELKAIDIEETSLRLTWKDNANNESAYEIYQDGVKVKTIAAGSNSVVISGLSAGTSYSFVVKAVNRLGSGDSGSLSIVMEGEGDSGEISLHIHFGDNNHIGLVQGESILKIINVIREDMNTTSDDYIYTLKNAPQGMKVINGYLSYITPDQAPIGKSDFQINVMDKKAKVSKEITVTLDILPSSKVLVENVTKEGGVFKDTASGVELEVPADTVDENTMMYVHKTIREDGGASYRLISSKPLNNLVFISLPESEEKQSRGRRIGKKVSRDRVVVEDWRLWKDWKADFLRIDETRISTDPSNRLHKGFKKIPINNQNIVIHRDIVASKLHSYGCGEPSNYENQCLGKIPILFVHGFVTGSGALTSNYGPAAGGGVDTWGKLPELIADHPGYSVFEFNWKTNSKFKDVAVDLSEAIDMIYGASGNKKVHIIAHSFGGLLSRTYLQNYAAENVKYQDNVASLLTLSTPHSGIFDVDTTRNGVTFLKGQDSISFEGCMQFSCYQAGEDTPTLFKAPRVTSNMIDQNADKIPVPVRYFAQGVGELATWGVNIANLASDNYDDIKQYMDVGDEPGELPAKLAFGLYGSDSEHKIPVNTRVLMTTTVSREDDIVELPSKNIPTAVANVVIDQVTKELDPLNHYRNGDELITYAGQRFDPKLANSDSMSQVFYNYNGITVTEKLLYATYGKSRNDKVDNDKVDKLFKGYRHSNSTFGQGPFGVTGRGTVGIAYVEDGKELSDTGKPHESLTEIRSWLSEQPDTANNLEYTLNIETPRVTLTWENNIYAHSSPDQYWIFRDGVEIGVVDSYTRSFDDLTAIGNKTYTYFVRASWDDSPFVKDSETVTVVVPDENTDSDHDGLPDLWEIKYGLTVGVNDAELDSDGDLYTNIQEYQGNTAPNDIDDKPKITADAGDDQTTTEGQSITLDGGLSASYAKITAYEWKFVDGLTLCPLSAKLTCEVSGLSDGEYEIILRVYDETGSSAIDDVKVTVNPTENTPPTADAKNISVTSGESVAIKLTGSDADGDDITYRLITRPNTAHGTLDGTEPNLTFTPKDGFTGTTSFSYVVNDTKVDSQEAVVTIKVNPTQQTSTSKLKKTGQINSYANYDDGHYKSGIAHNYNITTMGVLDRVTGLVWQDDADTNSTKKEWTQAKGYCSQKGANWRLPTRIELSSTISYNNYNPATDKKFAYVANDAYWTQSTSEQNHDNVWQINFAYGTESTVVKQGTNIYTRCVYDDNLPVANADKNIIVETGGAVHLSAANSVGTQNITEYLWEDQDSGGVWHGKEVSIDTLRDGIHNFTLTITDNAGNRYTDDIVVTIVSDNSQIKQTGQIKSYGKYDDGHYKKGANLKYTKEENSMLDRTTGVLWQDDDESSATKVSWDEANTQCLQKEGSWRLPTREELSSLIDYGNYNPAVTEHIFTHSISSEAYWTMSKSKQADKRAWVINFAYGTESTDSIATAHLVRCVNAHVSPRANAGTQQIVEEGKSLLLSGKYSSLPNYITDYVWERDSAEVGNKRDITLPNLSRGIYSFMLRIYDDEGAEDTDKVRVTVVYNNRYIKKTNQTQSYGDYDDGYYRKGREPSYAIDNGGVVDNVTGLTWENTLANKDKQINWEEAKRYCSNHPPYAVDAWRLPTREELSSLIDYARYNPAIDETFTNNTAAGGYWSLSDSKQSDNISWIVNFAYGTESTANKSATHHVRCVKSN